MKYLKMILIMLSLMALSGCLWFDFGGGEHGHEHHEEHR